MEEDEVADGSRSWGFQDLGPRVWAHLDLGPKVGGSRIGDPELEVYRIWEPARNSGMEAVTGAQCWDGCTSEEKMMMYMRRAHNGGLMLFRRACSAVENSATHPQNVQSNTTGWFFFTVAP